MANTKIVLNDQSDLILDNALITNPSGLTKSDISELVADLSVLTSADDSLETKIATDISTEESARIAGDESLETKISTDINTCLLYTSDAADE